VKSLLVLAGALAALMLAGCSAAVEKFSPDAGWFAKPANLFNAGDWAALSKPKEKLSSRPVGPEDLLSADGACASASPPVLAATDPPANAAPPSGVGIALDMTECDVVGRAGPPERFEVASNERGERTVVLTYLRGERPGIYRFVSGRLVSVERAGDAPPPAKPQRPVKRRAA
jgi:hypothetical protein